MQELGYDLIERLIQDIALLELPRDRVKAHLALLEYCDARRKSVELDTSLDKNIVPIVHFGIFEDERDSKMLINANVKGA